MRVMLISNTGFQYLAAVIPAMEKLGVVCKTVSASSFGRAIPDYFPSQFRRYYFDRKTILDLRDAIAAFRPDVVHVTGIRSVLLKVLVAMRPFETVAMVHERIAAAGMNVFSPLDPFLFRTRRIDRLIMPSRAMLNNWMGSHYLRWLAPPRRNEVLHYAFNLPAPTSAEQKRVLQRELGLNPDAFIIGSVCNIRPWKAVAFVAEIVASLDTARPVIFAVVGGWRSTHSQYIEKIRAAGGERLALLGHIPQAERVMPAFDLYTTPTYLPGESFGMAFAEAMSHGVPGITMNYGASAEVCDHGHTGYALPENKSVWRRHILELIENDALRTSMGQAARQRIAERFSPENRASDYFRIYQTAIEERGGWKERRPGA